MGRFLNKGNLDFASTRNDEYVDKSAMIQVINDTLDTPRRFTCVTRCRRFGKSMAAQMLYAYYDKSCDSRHLFEDLAIAKLPSFEEHLNKYPTLFVDMTEFTTQYHNDPDIVNITQRRIKDEICKMYPDVKVKDSYKLMDTLYEVVTHTNERFIMIIDEWEAICRMFEYIDNNDTTDIQDVYLEWLTQMFNSDISSRVFSGVYITGALPISRNKGRFKLDNFQEYSMINPGSLSTYFGFTEDEIAALATKHNVNADELAEWYGGYTIGHQQMFNPHSVKSAINRERWNIYWYGTSAYNFNVAPYINANFEGIKDDIKRMVNGERCSVNTSLFGNDLKAIQSKNDLLTILIHQGYLSYNQDRRECFVPNNEVRSTLSNALVYIH